MKKQFSFLIPLSFLIICLHGVVANPLFTNSRWIVDGNGKRVKLACVNWPSHLPPVLAEGLSHQPLEVITKKIRTMGFNCVRLTYPTYLLTNQSYAVTVRQSFQRLNLTKALAGIQQHNPSLLNLPLIQAYHAVVKSLGDNGVMAILDNHITVPGWCCDRHDGNGFFGDQHFPPDLWINGLTRMAIEFKGVKNVIGMSLRNELRGPFQNVRIWYINMQRGAEAIHKANPNVLVILSGLDFDANLGFLKDQQVTVSFKRKLVFEMHWYTFANAQNWKTKNANQACGSDVNGLKGRMFFLLQQGFPLFVSEFGMALSGTAQYEKYYLDCYLSTAADLDLDWAVWSLQGDYYFRQGKKGPEESYGVLNKDWSGLRDPVYLQKLSFIQPPFQGPGISKTTPYNIIYHPSTGLCVLKDPLRLGPCNSSAAWSYTPQNTVTLKGSKSCLQAVGFGKSPILGNACSNPSSVWNVVADSKLHLESKLGKMNVCLDTNNNGFVVTNQCKCLYGDPKCDPTSQWFKIISSARAISN